MEICYWLLSPKVKHFWSFGKIVISNWLLETIVISDWLLKQLGYWEHSCVIIVGRKLSDWLLRNDGDQ